MDKLIKAICSCKSNKTFNHGRIKVDIPIEPKMNRCLFESLMQYTLMKTNAVKHDKNESSTYHISSKIEGKNSTDREAATNHLNLSERLKMVSKIIMANLFNICK